MRISDWSSDVCSSDLDNQHRKLCPLPPQRAWRGSGRSRGRKARRLAVYHPASCSFEKNILRPRPLQVYRIDQFMGARSEGHTSELQSLMRISYGVVCLTKKLQSQKRRTTHYLRVIIHIS